VSKDRIKELRREMEILKAREAAILAANKGFARLSKQAKRVAIAKDVIAQIKLDVYNAKTGVYVSNLDIPDVDDASGMQLCELLIPGTTCDVCARGALFCSLVRKQNNVTLDDVGIDSYYGNDIDPYNFEDSENDIWGNDQIGLIESAFECKNMWYGGTDDYDSEDNESKTEKAIAFGKKYKSAESRMIGIMENIIKNKGTFVP